MSGFADMHCHLCAGLDDGPKSLEEALEMCRIAWDEGTRHIAATCHQNEGWPRGTADAIRTAVAELRQALSEMAVPLQVYPTAEIMLRPTLLEEWQRGELVSVADLGKYLLIELPGGFFVDMKPVIVGLREIGVRTILAHPERQPELLHEPGIIEDWISAGALVQVSSGSLIDQLRPGDRKILRQWAERGIIHVLGSDGHSPRRRRPHLAEAVAKLEEWIGTAGAHQIAARNGLRVLRGEEIPTNILPPKKPNRWFDRLWFA